MNDIPRPTAEQLEEDLIERHLSPIQLMGAKKRLAAEVVAMRSDWKQMLDRHGYFERTNCDPKAEIVALKADLAAVKDRLVKAKNDLAAMREERGLNPAYEQALHENGVDLANANATIANLKAELDDLHDTRHKYARALDDAHGRIKELEAEVEHYKILDRHHGIEMDLKDEGIFARDRCIANKDTYLKELWKMCDYQVQIDLITNALADKWHDFLEAEKP